MTAYVKNKYGFYTKKKVKKTAHRFGKYFYLLGKKWYTSKSICLVKPEKELLEKTYRKGFLKANSESVLGHTLVSTILILLMALGVAHEQISIPLYLAFWLLLLFGFPWLFSVLDTSKRALIINRLRLDFKGKDFIINDFGIITSEAKYRSLKPSKGDCLRRKHFYEDIVVGVFDGSYWVLY